MECRFCNGKGKYEVHFDEYLVDVILCTNCSNESEEEE